MLICDCKQPDPRANHFHWFGQHDPALCIKLITTPDETSSVIADYAHLHGRVNRLDEMLQDMGVSFLLTLL